MKRVKIWLMGGFGNVLFQVLFAKQIEEQGKKVIFITNLTEDNAITRFLLNWTIHPPIYTKILGDLAYKRLYTIQAIYSSILFTLSKILKRKVCNHTYELPGVKSNNYLGYYQEKAFINNSLRLIPKLSEELRLCLPVSKRLNIVIHFRGKDSLNLDKNIGFLKKCLLEFPEAMVITDDIAMAKIFVKENQLISSSTVEEDFSILVNAIEILICSDSTFSFWAAAFNNTAKILGPSELIQKYGDLNGKIIQFP